MIDIASEAAMSDSRMSITFDEYEIGEVLDSHGRVLEYELRIERLSIYTLAQLRQEVGEEIERRKNE